MNAATEFDVGPLTWVKSEIDLALERADQALLSYSASLAAGAGDFTQIKFGRTHLHQVQGALTIVGLDGVTQFAEALEALLEAIERQERPFDEGVIALARRALAVIGHYLNDLVSGQPNQPLRLLTLYREIQSARGLERVSATDLFFPDLSVRPPRREAPAKKISHSDFQALLRQERARFQRGLLAWLRAPQDRSGVSAMLSAVKRIEETQEAALVRSFWWVAGGFLAALSEGSLPQETNVKQLCARIDLQIRRLLEGSKNVAERLMRDALYYVASADSRDSTVRQVKKTYHLQSVMPSTETTAPAPEETVRRRLREVIAATEEAWSKYCTGSRQALPAFKEHAGALSVVVEQLGHTDYRRLAQAIAAAANWLSDDSSRQADALAMEVATAILLAHNAQENFPRLGSDFAHQVDVTVARIHACFAGIPPQPGSEIPLLDEMSRQAQEKLLVGQVAKEIQSNFAQIEQVLDGFFRDTEKRADLAALDVPFRQVAGALTMMHHDAAAVAVRECSAEIKRFADPGYAPQDDDFERVANQLSLIGFFIDSLQHGATDFDSFTRQMQTGASDAAAEDDEEEDEPGISVEQEVEQKKLEIHAQLGALKENSGDAALREDIKRNLVSLKNDAELLADRALGEQAKAMQSALEGGDASSQIDQLMAKLRPQAPESQPPPAEAVVVAAAASDAVDSELLGIFLEEANEVLASIGHKLELLRARPNDSDVLTTIRRSFHTLKGSGRMVGLKDVGEAAWAIEQTLNFWLQQELDVGSSLLDLLGQAHVLFADWVRHLETRSGSAPDPAALIAFAESLRRAPEESHEAAMLDEAAGVDEREEAETRADEVVPETAQALEEQRQSAEIITLNFPASASRPESDDGDFTFAHETIELLDVDLGIPASDAPSDAGDVSLPETATAPATETEETVSARPETQQRISISPSLYEIYSEEAHAHLATLRRELVVLESDRSTPTPHEMYRAAHTLAGISATVGIDPVNRLGLALEHALLRRNNAALPDSAEALAIIRQAVDEVELMLTTLARQREPEPCTGLIEALDALYPATVAAPSAPAAEEEAAPVPSTASGAAAPADVAAEEVAPFTAPAAAPVTEIRLLEDEIDRQLLPIFLEEAVDLNQGIASQLRAWRNSPNDDEAVRTLARLLHTLKGSARMAGAMNLGEITHAIESRVEHASRTGNAPPEVIDEIDSAFDAVVQIIERLQRGESLDQSPATPAEGIAAARPVAEPTVEPVAKSGAEPVAEPAVVPEPAPVIIERRMDRRRIGERMNDGDAAAQGASLRVRADLVDRLVNEAGELSIARARIEGEMRSLKESLIDLTENVIRLRRQLREIEIQAESQMQSHTAQPGEQHPGFDPLEFDRFTRFQELTRMMAESVNDVSTVQQNLLKNLDDANAAILAQARLNREVQQKLMAVRMVPFGSLADRLYRIVRQTSKELDKRVNLEIDGGQLELDRSVLDKMGAPLEHMLRNAIVHGLEERDIRLARGKPEIGEIALALKQEGNEIILNFSDDGGGLDFAAIRARAIERGLLAADEVADTARLANLIFSAGFSTASEVSQVAGRGVGMDVVKTEISRLGGRIEIVSTPGQGTEFQLYIPLTLAVTKALLVRVGNKRYAIPSVMIEQVLDLKEAALTSMRDSGAAEWMGNRYPFSYLPQLLGEREAQPEQHRQYWVLLLRSGSRRIAVQVDELMGNQEIVVKNIGPQLARVVGVDGATVLGDGQVVLILNPVALSTREPLAEPAAPEDGAPVEAAAALPTVMVVDDSLTVRKITGRLLAREGYQVVLAKDGVEALEQLLDVIPDVMLVDIEMPRMDGFDLTRNIRADERLKAIPIIMITSRTADKHRAYAFEIGVNHYLGKPYQEDELLTLVASFVTKQRRA